MIDTLPRISHNLRNSIRDLHRSSHRDERQEFLAEGPHVLDEILRAGIRPGVVIVRDDASFEIQDLVERCVHDNIPVFASGGKDMELMSDASAPQAVLCAAPYRTEETIGERILVLDAVSDPGNVGTMIRCAAWFGFTDVVLGVGCADLYNPKTIRSTVGAAFHINVLRKRELSSWLHDINDRPRFAAVARGGESPDRLVNESTFALVIGSEAHGISADVEASCTARLSIPGSGGSESLNAAMAAAILCYEGRKR